MNAIALALVLSASTTDLGVFVAGDDAASQTLLAACPAVAVFPLPNTAAQAQVAALRTSCPQSTVVFQVGGTQQPFSAVANYSSYWPTWQPLIAAAGGAPGDWVEGPTELTGVPDPQQLASFWSGLAGLIAGATYKPIVGGLAPGLPPSVPLGDGGTENQFCQTLRVMAQSGVQSWGWSYHALAPTLDESAQSQALAYRTILQQCVTAGGVPASTTIFLTQAGRTTGSWTSSDLTWLTWFDGQLRQDAVVAAIFQAGVGVAGDRSLSPIATQLANYLRNSSPTDGGTPDGGSDAAYGGVGPSGGFVPSGSPGNYPKSGCATSGAGFALLALLPPLALARRRRRA